MPMWMRLSHLNVLPFHGVSMRVSKLALVYDWCENGNITQYTASHPDASRTILVCMAIVTVEDRFITNWVPVR